MLAALRGVKSGQLLGMRGEFNPADYSVVVKLRGTLPKPCGDLESSPIFFESMSEAAKEGKKALARFFTKRAA